MLTTFNPPWLNSNLTKFEPDSNKSVGGVQSGVEKGKTAPICSTQNGRLPVDRHYEVPGFFVRLGMTKACSEFRPATQN